MLRAVPTIEDIVVIGSGPAGLTAALYAARAMRNPLLFAGAQPGGQLTVTTDVENYPGFPEPILGPELTERMRLQAERAGTRVVYDEIVSVDFTTQPLKLIGGSGTEYLTRTLVIASGAQAKWLGVTGEETWRGFGVSACAVCDGFFFKGKTVGVVGGGNTAVEEALYLTNFAQKVYLLHRRNTLRAEAVLQKRLQNNPKIEFVPFVDVVEMHGTPQPCALTHVTLRDSQNHTTRDLALDGLFVAIGHAPATKPFINAIACDENGYIKVTAGSTHTSAAGVFAAGDVADHVYRQAVTAAGTGCMAALDALRWLDAQ